MKAMLVLLNVLVIPLIIDGINLPLTKGTEDDICTFDDELCGNGRDGGNDDDSHTSRNGRRNRRSRRSHGIKTSRYSYQLHDLAVQL
jgi:hypothetical protein